jgi:hypothetical protein
MLLWLDRLSRCGRCRVVGMSGEVGSFLTTILGAGPRDLRGEWLLDMSDMMSLWGGDMEVEVGEEAEGGRHDEVEDREERLNDVRKR